MIEVAHQPLVQRAREILCISSKSELTECMNDMAKDLETVSSRPVEADTLRNALQEDRDKYDCLSCRVMGMYSASEGCIEPVENSANDHARSWRFHRPWGLYLFFWDEPTATA